MSEVQGETTIQGDVGPFKRSTQQQVIDRMRDAEDLRRAAANIRRLGPEGLSHTMVDAVDKLVSKTDINSGEPSQGLWVVDGPQALAALRDDVERFLAERVEAVASGLEAQAAKSDRLALDLLDEHVQSGKGGERLRVGQAVRLKGQTKILTIVRVGDVLARVNYFSDASGAVLTADLPVEALEAA